MLGEDDDGMFRLPVSLKKSQLNGSFVVAVDNNPDSKGQYVYKWETCAICFQLVKGARVFSWIVHRSKTAIVRRVAKSRRLSMADKEESSDCDDDGSVYEDATNKCAQRLLIGFSFRMLNEALVRYDLPSKQSRRKAAEVLADKLLNDNDDNDEEN